MTERKTVLRRRRTTAGNVPKVIADWFAGTYVAKRSDGAPLAAVAHPGIVLLGDWWEAWQASNPRAVPPAGFEWLSDPEKRAAKRVGPAYATAVARAKVTA